MQSLHETVGPISSCQCASLLYYITFSEYTELSNCLSQGHFPSPSYLLFPPPPCFSSLFTSQMFVFKICEKLKSCFPTNTWFFFNPVTYSFEICLYMMEEPGRLQSMMLRRVGHDWAPSFSLFTFKHWRRKWQPTPVFLPGESQGQGNLVGCHLWDCTESDTTEVT